MAGELQADSGVTGQTVYFLVRSPSGTVWNGAALVTYVSGNFATYPVTGTEEGTSGYYTGNMPAVAAGVYSVVAKKQAGGSPAETDPTVAQGDVWWSGAAVATPQSGDAFSRIGAAGAGLTAVALAAAGLDLVLVAGKTLPNAIKYVGAAVAGKASGAGTGTETYDDFSGSVAFVATIDTNGNRTGMSYS